MEISVRPFVEADITAALALWRATPGVGLSAADEPAALARYLARNPGLSLVADVHGTLVGTLLCGHDGRRGLIHHLVAAHGHRRRPASMRSWRSQRAAICAVVRHQHQRGAGFAVQLEHQLHHLLAGGEVQAAGGLVGQQHRRLDDEGARQRHALLLAARQHRG
jgi:hypothetical protein